jgi:hypothetical protein
MTDNYNKQQFKCSPAVTNAEYKQFIGYDQREDSCGENFDLESDQTHKKRGPKRRERKEYNKEHSQAINQMASPEFFKEEKPLQDKLSKFIIEAK